MGQTIEIDSTEIVDDAVIVTMNRSLTSQDGEGFDSAEGATSADSFAATLAERIFGADDSVSRVYVASNTVIIKRPTGWPDAALSAITGVIEDLFLFYPAR